MRIFADHNIDMKVFLDKIFIGILSFLTRIIYCPKVYYADGAKRSSKIDAPAILVCNHTSHLDGAILSVALKDTGIVSLAAKDRFEQKWFGFLLRHTNCIPIDRQHPDTTWIHDSLRILSEGKNCIAIYPEGRHGTFRHQLPFHSGVTMLAALARTPVVVVYIDGPHKAFHRSRIIVSAPMQLETPEGGLNAEAIEKCTVVLQDRMTALMNELIAQL